MISALWTGEPSSPQCSAELGNARERGSLVICAPVYCELHACPGVTPAIIRKFLEDTHITADLQVGEEIWQEASVRFARYANRRRKLGGDSPKRILADFIVGAHALLRADCLLTLDQGRYTRDFPELKLL